MKKLFAILFVLTLAFTFVSCSSCNDEDNGDNTEEGKDPGAIQLPSIDIYPD